MRLASLFAAVGWIALNAVNVTSACAQGWPQFRGPAGDGVVPGQHPDRWTPKENIAWKSKIPGVGWSQPVCVGGKVLVTTAVAERQARPKPGDWSPGDGIGGLSLLIGSVRRPPAIDYQWNVLCLQADTGQVLWETTVQSGRPKVPVHPNNSYATETPATDGERVIAAFCSAGIHCLDLDGKLLWSKDLGTYPTQMDWGTASSPVLLGELVYVQCDNEQASFLVALDKRTGGEVWRKERDERSNWCTPLVWKHEQRTELVVGGGTKIRSYDPATGELFWEMAASGRCSQSPVAAGGLVFVNTGDRLTGQRGLLAAIRPGARGDISLAEGSQTGEFVAWSVTLTGHGVASPLAAGDCLYLLDQQSGIIRCLDATSGKQHYRQRLPGATGLTASPWTCGGKVYCLDQSGQTFVLEPGPELRIVATNRLGDEMFWASPAFADGAIFLRSLDQLYCIR
jgi:outer membrane protein assembly factor BamB